MQSDPDLVSRLLGPLASAAAANELVFPGPSRGQNEPSGVSATSRVAVPRARLLVIDDEPFVARALCRTLGGHDVSVLHHAREALPRFASTRFDLVFCDLMMPNMTGMDLYEAVLASPQAAQSDAFVFMTGGAFTPRARDFLERVGAPCLEKPFDSSLVRELVANAIARRAAPLLDERALAVG